MLLTIDQLNVSYGRVPALRDVSLEVDAGEVVVLLGPNGAGKTTLLRTISGLLRPNSGAIRLAGQSVGGRPPHAVARAGIAHVPQGRQVFPDLSVADNLEMGGYLWRGQRAIYSETLESVLTLFPRLAERRTQLAGTLSGGEQQMLAVGRALMSRPRLLMLDEPSLGLAPRLVQEMFGFLRRLHEERGLSILLVEQVAALALELAGRGYVLVNGSVAMQGAAAELAADTRVQEAYMGTKVSSGAMSHESQGWGG